MRYPKDFGGWNGNKRYLTGYPVCILQWGSGKTKTFAVEVLGLSVHQNNYFPIPGKGDEALQKAIDKAYEWKEKIKEGGHGD
ncbi:MAG: hypothetical protein Q4B26_12005 [Eubacteriales bacterium]|nr:hypothetical protein [Eubacteriales bacterium]